MALDLYSIQETIEQQSRAETALKFHNELNTKIQDGEQSKTYFGSPLLKRAIEPLAERIRDRIKGVRDGRAFFEFFFTQ